MNILLTGATGFLGKRLACAIAADKGLHVTAVVRNCVELPVDRVFEITGIDVNTNWLSVLTGQQVVIHTAARAHVMKSESVDSLAQYRKINVDGTLNLARQAAAAGVQRFIFISSIGVNGNVNSRPFTESDAPKPVEPYAQSKWEAEKELWTIQQETGIEIVIIRPPLVYGPNAPGNFLKLVSWVESGVPLPFGCISNRRSLIAIDNLVDLIMTCINHPAAANQVFLAGDGQDLSTTELLRGVAKAMGKTSRLIPVPVSMMMLAAVLLGKRAMAQRIFGSLQVDISKARDTLDWEPPLSTEEGLKRCFESENNV